MAGSNLSDFSDDASIRHWLRKMEYEQEVIPDTIEMNYSDLHKAIIHENIENCIQILEKPEVNTNEKNAKGDTTLHLASRKECQNADLIFDLLISRGANINARNLWDQTPLHHAAIRQSLNNLQILINIPDIDINAVDINGYNALHYFIASSVGSDQWDSTDTLENQLPEDLRRGISLLVHAGIPVNTQTKYGYSILHLAATREDNTPLIKYFLTNLSGVDMKLKNKMDETFLHVYVRYEAFEETMDTLEHIARIDIQRLRELLNMGNSFGRTPWEIMIDNAEINTKSLNTIIEKYRVFIRRADTLGNTALHRIAGVFCSIVLWDILETFILAGADISAKNIYGELPTSVLFLEDVFRVFFAYNMNFNSSDRWGRSPLVSIMKHRPIPRFLEALIREVNVNVNTVDVYGSSPLHFAAYNNYPEQIEILLRNGAKRDIVDSLNDSPFGTVRRHCSFHCYELLKPPGRSGDSEVLYRRNMSFSDILLHIPRHIKLTDIKTPEVVQSVMNLQYSVDEFSDYLLSSYYDRSTENGEEVSNIIAEVNNMVESLCRKIESYDPRFRMTVFPTGSSAEGTKVGHPDEFDFVLRLDKLEELCDIIVTEQCLATSFAFLKFRDVPEKDEFMQFSDFDRYFLAFPFLQYLFRYLRKALNAGDIWKSGNLYYTFEDKITVIHGKPVFNFDVYWIGSVYKQLKISIDLVPAVYMKGWWPPNISLDDLPLMNEKVKAAGCFLLLQTKSNDFDSQKHTLNDSINNTCNVNDDNKTCNQKRMLRISAAPAEILLMKTLPEKFRRGYALAKIVKGKEVCPQIEVNEIPTQLLTQKLKFQSKTTLPLKSSSFVKSYMLKNCIFNTYQDLQTNLESVETLKISEIAAQAYTRLLNFSDERIFQPYFLPYTDVFGPEKAERRSTYDECMFHLKREYSVKLILGILNHPFPDTCLASKLELGAFLCEIT